MVARTKSRTTSGKATRVKKTAHARSLREQRTPYRHTRWKIPNITPIGSDAPVSKTLPLAVKRIAETLDPEKIILFGSYAYGNPTPDSDVDLQAVMPSQEPEIERYLTVSRLLRPRPFAVDILVKTLQEITSSIQNGNFFIDEIVTQGKVLYERPQKSS